MLRQVQQYLERFFNRLYVYEMSDCLAMLSTKIRNIDETILYTQQKKTQLQLLIDRETVALENKYIDLLDAQHMR
ncbi:hypothetical protein ACYCJG_04255 [Staphylococcus chromogenes]|nr:hypothetical protein [Staphylococcus chromogenes]PTF31226.1 hypothetical protein BUY14_04390 [Staphylococcus chromogenes]PTH01219.1 hypothetical protein BU636_05490 [Staphylococcus chromogenes]PUZ18016.1 hypothetical protein BUX99_02130 [Staphylococcus chromogenes]RIL94605.1 hypothetical protein BUY05_07305 [Staphylococcus chromogenes]RIL97303.1 hypothetical protein BU690_02160 [Staphylococcus chromogenes]